MNKQAFEIWEIVKNDKTFRLLLPIGCEAADAYGACHEFLQGIVSEITRLTEQSAPKAAPEAPVEVVDKSTLN